MSLSFNYIDYLVLGLYALILLYVGFRFNKKEKNQQDIFLGGRTLKWWQIGFSIFGANAGPMMLIGFASIGFTHGIVASNFELLAWVFLMLLAMVFLPYYLKTKITTIPQFLLIRFGKRSYNFLIVYSLISILVVWLGSALYAGGLLISGIFGISLFTAIAVIAVIATSFTAIGGLKAVVRTGVFQSVIIIISSVILTFLGFQKIGSVDALVSQTPESYWKLFLPASNAAYSWVGILLGYPVVAIYYWCADQTIVQKVLAARDLKEGQYGAIFIGTLKVIMPIIFILPGIMCYVLFRDTAPDNAYITMIKELMPHGLLGLSIAALIASLVDTVSSSLNSFCTVFTLDVVQQFKVLNREQQVRMGKWVTVVAAIVGVGIALLFSYSGKGFFDLTQGLVSILSPPLAVVFLWGIFWKRINGKAAEIVLYGGGFICLVLGACHVLNYPYEGYWPHFLMLSFYIFVALSVVIVAVTLLTKSEVKTEVPTLLDVKDKMGSSSSIWWTWAALATVMMAIYIYFN
ncbi:MULTISPECIES: SLC5 family protein [unclassified Sphingobacterium]|uniref:SLC5 family protein n=1 Tax=unclassified Sphingobacterium TaxID=2609468 RepID=UPI0010D0C963|nr:MULTISPECIES: sodium/solute symporter [unclassified Sphingobacterium]MCS3556818.1 SSS family solute:Na+ symporter [Sphingobacterium sp. JUb21]TCQ99256.1 SSS family solute:Na+ symporter [Sphingobacterium sp. JUb20]